MLPVDTTDRLHTTIDRAADAAAQPFRDAGDQAPRHRAIFDRLALRAARTVRLESYSLLNEHELT